MTTPTEDQPADDSLSNESPDAEDTHETSSGGAWQINDPTPDESTTETDGQSTRSSDENTGGAWQINENTKG